MQRHMVPALVGISIFPLAAAGIAAYLMAAGVTLVATAILMLAAGMVLAAVMIMVRLSHQDAVLADQHVVQDELEARIKTATARLVGLEEQSRRSTAQATRSEEIMTELNALRREMKDLAQSQRQASQASAAPPPAQAAPAAAPAPAAEQPAGRDELTLWLEPVIELASGDTSHYRALVGLTDSSGKTVSHDEVMQKADQGGLRASLDARLVKMVIPVLRRLRLRNPGLRIFVPVGRATLSAREEVVRLLALLRRDGDLTDGIVFDLAQQDLGLLDGGGIENLARLGRSGAMLSVSSADPGGLDLTALRKLGVNYLSCPADAGASWTGIAKTARVLKIEIVIAAIRTQQQAATAGKLGRYGYGPHFAPPRKVRADAGIAAAPARRASAA